MLIRKAWHSSDHVFAAPDHAKAREVRRARHPHDSRHENGDLGFWVSLRDTGTNHDGFGRHLYEMELWLPSGRAAQMPISQLMKLVTPEQIESTRQRLQTARIAALLLLESDGRTDQAIIVDTTVIRSFRLVSSR